MSVALPPEPGVEEGFRLVWVEISTPYRSDRQDKTLEKAGERVRFQSIGLGNGPVIQGVFENRPTICTNRSATDPNCS